MMATGQGDRSPCCAGGIFRTPIVPIFLLREALVQVFETKPASGRPATTSGLIRLATFDFLGLQIHIGFDLVTTS
jgi:hypothetical protein